MQVALVLAALAIQVPTPSVVRPALPIRDWLLGAPAVSDAAPGPPAIEAGGHRVAAGPDALLRLDAVSREWPAAGTLVAAAAVLSPREESARLVVTRSAAVTVWLNRQRLAPPDTGQGTRRGGDTIDIRLAAGWNSLVVVLPRLGTFGAWLVGDGPFELATGAPAEASADNLPAESFTVSPLTVHRPLSWRGAALEAEVSVRVTAWGRSAPNVALLHLVVAGDTLTIDPIAFAAPAAPVTVRRVRDLGSLSRAALAPTQARQLLVTPGHVSVHPAALGPGPLLALLDGPIRLAGWHLDNGALEARVVIPPSFAGLTLDLLVTDLGPHARYAVNGAAVQWREGFVTLCAPCRDGATIVARIDADPSWPTVDLPVVRVRGHTYTDLSRNWSLLSGTGRGTAPDPAAWLSAMLDAGKTAYRTLASHDGARIQAAGASFRGDTIYLLGQASPGRDTGDARGSTPERTWRAALAARHRFPAARFAAGDAWAYHRVASLAPTLLDSIRHAVRAGAWSPVGGLWASTDPSAASGESLVRQGLYGQAEFQRLFERRCSVAWAPEGVALPWTQPQIWRGLGMGRLVAAGGSGPGPDAAPDGAFLWEGRDGSQLFTYRAREQAVDGEKLVRALASAPQRRVLALYDASDSLDGGFTAALRFADELRRLPAFGTLVDASPEVALGALQRPAGSLPVWRRELPPAAANQRPPRTGDRTSLEAQLLATELLSTMDTTTYPVGGLARAWRLLLEGPRISAADDDGVWAGLRTTQAAALERLAQRLDTRGGGAAVVVFNPSSWVRSARVAVPLDADLRRSRRLGLARVTDAAHRTAPAVFDEDSLYFFAREVPPLGAKVFWLDRGRAPGGGVEAGPARLENALLAVDVDTLSGRLQRVYDKARDRDLLARESGGNWLAPLNQDGLPDAATSGGRGIGPARAVRRGGGVLDRWIELEHPWDGGRLVQRFVLRRDEPILTVESRVEGARHGLLATFHLAVAADSAWAELPYGAAALPTAADSPRPFTPRLQWTDISAAGFGVSVLTDRPAIWDVRGTTVRFALAVDGEDSPTHRAFRYALYAHAGDWREGGTPRRAAELAAPLLAARVGSHGGPAGHAWSLLTLDADHVYVGAVKRAEIGRPVVVRLVEGQGRAGRVTLTFAHRVARVRTANLLEDPLAIVPLRSEHSVTLSLAPWEIVTLLIDEAL